MSQSIKTHFELTKFQVVYIGASSDLRTNKWRVTCLSCKKSYEPATTMIKEQLLECPKCGASEIVNYNNLS